jgi:aldehyde dehydrogenase
MSRETDPTDPDEVRVRNIVRQVIAQMGEPAAQVAAPARSSLERPTAAMADGVHPDVDAAVRAAGVAFRQLSLLTLEKRKEIIAAMRAAGREAARDLARLAVEESGLGQVEHKVLKNLLAVDKTPGVEDIEPTAWSGDRGLMLQERAPYGVLGAITPVTNPACTIICNSIGMIAAGNAVVFNCHPNAKRVSVAAVQMLHRAIVAAGGPSNLICTVPEPTIQSAQALMKHPGIRLLVVTGGPGVVAEAMKSGKRAVCAGPGNPPVVVDESADIDQAARDIVLGASFDNNIICVLEKEIIVVESVADALKAAMLRNGCVELGQWQMKQLERVIFTGQLQPGRAGEVNKAYVGKRPSFILREIGLTVEDSVKLAVAEVNRDHPLVWTEQLMPVIPLVRVRNADEAIDLAIAAEQGNYHTAMMHSKHLDHLSRMARECNCSIFVKNGPSLAGLGFGGEGYTSYSIASPTGEGVTRARSFTRDRRCTLVDAFRIV